MKIFLLVLIGFSYNFAIAQHSIVHEVSYVNKPIVEMTLNGKKVWVLLDTGSAITIFNIEAKEKHGFQTFLIDDDKFKVPGFGSEGNQLLQVRKVKLKFGEVRLRQQFFAFDLSNIVSSISSRTGKEIVAIIGTNMMSTYGFVIDMGQNTVSMRLK